MKIHTRDFRISRGGKIKLRHRPTSVRPFYQSEQHYRELLAADAAKLDGLQRLLFASGQYAVLLIFQAMDAGGKDGAIDHVLTGVNPEGCEVTSFKAPSEDELKHDFLWRTTCRLPARGRIGVFNRSYYEEVLITRVHAKVLQRAGLPPALLDPRKLWKGRYRSIVELEKHLHRNGTQVIKFHLHISKAEQRRRFLARLEDPDKQWKFSLDDLAERKFWHQYRKAYEACLGATGTQAAPWHVVPADDKYNARLIVARIVIDALQRLPLRYPKLKPAQRGALRVIRRKLRG